MEVLRVRGGRPLSGQLRVQGAKNSVLPLLAAAILGRGVSVIRNCPRLTDVDASVAILEHLGCAVRWEEDTLYIDAAAPCGFAVPTSLARAMRSSVIFLGPILARLGRAEMSYPGGCELGPRPIDLHLSALRTLGAEIREGPAGLVCAADDLRGGEITLTIPSVGATENAMLCAVAARGTTAICNAAREPEIVQLQDFLRSMGAQVRGAGSSVITVQGGEELHGGEVTVMGDRIVAATYLCGCAAVGGDVELVGVESRHLSTVTALLAEAGCEVESGEGRVRLRRDPAMPLRCVHAVRTAPYPGFPTDAQAVLMAALLRSQGATVFVENIFENRYRHVDELRRMGADIQVAGRTAMVTGVGKLHGASLRSTDLRGGAALVVAALGAEGTSRVSGLRHIRRGYQALDKNLRALGADIREIP